MKAVHLGTTRGVPRRHDCERRCTTRAHPAVRQVVGRVLELSHSSRKSSQHTDFTASKTPMTCLVSADASPLLPQANSVLSPAESS